MKTRRNRRYKRQKGGFWPFTSSTDPATTYSSPTPSSSWSDWFSGLGNKAKETTTGIVSGTENVLTSASNSVSEGLTNVSNATSNILSTDVPLTGNSYQTAGRRRKNKRKTKKCKHKRKMKGGNKLGLTYYATPVSGIKMAQPTTWI